MADAGASSLHYRAARELPRTDFLGLRQGPWPQPAPDSPMGMVAEVLHPLAEDVRHWNWTARINYIKALVTKFPLALYNWFIHNRIEHLSDAECARMLTTSSYSKFLRRRSASQLDDTIFRARLGAFDAQTEYLLTDFTTMTLIRPYPGIHVAPTISLCARARPGDACVLLAIAIGHQERADWKYVVLTPEDRNAWTLAKYFVIQGAGHMISLSGHPASHFPYDTVNAITVSAVPMRHTLFRLLEPHLPLHLAVDNAVLQGGHSIVSETRGEIYAPFAGCSDEVRKLVPTGYQGFPAPEALGGAPIQNYRPWTYPRNAGDIPSDYGRVLSAYYATVRRFVQKAVAHIDRMRGTDEGEEERYYIGIWAWHISQWLPGFPDRETILAPDDARPDEPMPRLTDALTTYIWDVAVAHSLEHSTFNRLGPHRTSFRVRVPPPDSREAPAHARSEILSGWDIFKSTLAFEMFFKPHVVTRLLDAQYRFGSESLRAAADEFKADLLETERRLEQLEHIRIDDYIRVGEMSSSIQY